MFDRISAERTMPRTDPRMPEPRRAVVNTEQWFEVEREGERREGRAGQELQLLYICQRFAIHTICAYDHVATVTAESCPSSSVVHLTPATPPPLTWVERTRCGKARRNPVDAVCETASD